MTGRVVNADSGVDKAVKIVSALGVIVGIGYTAYQIKEAAKTEEAALVYQIQRDGRDILDRVSSIEHYVDCVHREAKCDEPMMASARNGIRFVLQFYSSVFNQYRMDALAKEYWSVFSEEVCDYAKLPRVNEYWDEYATSYSQPFREVLGSC